MKTSIVSHGAFIALSLLMVGPIERASAQTSQSANSKTGLKRNPQLPWWFEDESAFSNRAHQFYSPDATNGPSTWLGGAGAWSNGAMWNPAGAPNATDADVFLDGGNTGTASAVTLNGSFTAGRLTIDAGDSLTINDNSSLVLAAGAFVGSGTILNNGNIMLNSVGNLTDINFTGASVAFNGTGTITMGGNFANRILGGTVTIGAGQTIQGGGSLGSNATTIINNGTILANAGTLRVDPESVNGLTNNSFMRASSGGTLELSGSGAGTFFNTGTIEALSGSQVTLTNGAIVSGGILSTTGNGTIQGISGTLTNVTNNGSFVIADNRSTSLTGTLTNNGNIALNSVGNLTDLNLSGGSVTINGTGTITLGGSAANRILNGSLTIGAAQTIQGGGSLGSNSTTIINNGTILANSGLLRVDPEPVSGLTNNNFMRASGGGTLELSGNAGGTFFNAGTIEALAGSRVQLTNGAIVSGGIVSTTGDGTVQGMSGTLTNVTNNGSFVIADSRTTFLTGVLTNNGNVALNSVGNLTDLNLSGGSVTIGGTGTVTLGGNAANRILNGTLTIGAGQTIQGGGSIGANTTTITNNGIILATAGNLLTLDPDNTAGGLTNNNILRATGGGMLRLTGNSGAFANSATGVIEAQTGSEVQLTAGASISGGTFNTAGTGVVRELNGQEVTISNLTNAGTFVVNDNAFLHVNGAITNNGSLTLVSVGNGTDILIDSNTTFGGTGTVTLSGSSNARVRTATAGTRLTIGANQTFNGQGQIGLNTLAVTNLGLIDANVAGGHTLEIDPVNVSDGFLNQATMQASNGGVLRFTGNAGGAVNNTGGIIQAVGMGSMGEASEVQFGGSFAVSGGTLTTSGGGIVRVTNSTEATISNLTSAGTFIVNDNSFLHVNGMITNNGTLSLNSVGNATDIVVDSDTTFAGSGTVFMTGALNSRVRAGVAGARLTIGANQTFSGRGQIGFNTLAVTNLGLIDANIGGQVLQIDAVNAANGFLNQATMQASNGGVLAFIGNDGGDISNTGGIIQAVGAASEVQLSGGAAISGGTLSTSTGGVVRELNGQVATISNLTNAGTFVVNDNAFLHTVGTITDNGTITINSSGNATDLVLDGDVTFVGTGSVTLANSNNARVRANAGTSHLANSAGHTFNGRGQLGLNTLLITNAGTIDANVSGQTLTIDPANVSGAFLNDTTGTVRASGGGTASLTGSNGGDFTNNGIFEALNASALTMDASAVLTNNMSGVLTLGSYRAFSTGGAATLTIRGANITQLAANTEVILSGAGSMFQVGGTALESTLLTNNGALRILANRNYTNTNALTDNGIIELGGGIFNAPGLTIGLSGELFGFGSVSVRPDNSGLVRAVGGTLALTNGLGTAGTVQSDATGTIDLSGSAAASSSNFLFNNGNLALGGQNFVVTMDYNNANFGVGNSFDPRAHVTGAGMINAAGNVGQTLSGMGVINGVTATPLMAFGNVHVGDAPTRTYQVNNIGTSGPTLRGALQTSANGGNITDGRLGGTGVTASNFGPISLGGNGGTLGVTFNATAAGALNGQLLHIVNNFDNVAEQNLSITGAAFRYANPNGHTPEPIAFGNFHVGDTVTNVFLSLTNNVPADGFSEALNAMIGGATGGVTTNGGVFNLLAPGATNNNALAIGLNAANAGNQGGTATITLQSDGTGSSGLGITNLPSQVVNITGSVFRFASPTLHLPEPVVLANQHVGDSLAQALSITNQAVADGFSEALNASITGTSGTASGSGMFNLLGAGSTNNSSLFVGVDTSVAGTRGGTATIGLVSNGSGTSGLGLTALPSQTVTVSGNVYRYANPTTHTPEPVAFGVHHVGDSVSNVFVSLTNNTPADGFSEALNASIGGASAGLTTNGGSFTGLAPGATNNNSLSVGINTATAGSRNGTATLTLQSNGTGSSGLGNTNLPSQTVTVTGQVNYFADPVFSLQSGVGTVTMNSATVFTLNLGQVMQNSGTLNAMLAIRNFLHDVTFQDSLGGTFDLTTVNDFLLTGFDPFSGVASGAAITPGVAFNTAMPEGTYTDTIFLIPTSSNASGTSNLTPIQLNVQAQIVVVPEPGSWAMILTGVVILCAFQRLRRRSA